MTIFVAHAPADREAAEALERHLERRGHFVELDDGQTALRPVQRGDAVVLLLSQDLVFATARLRLEQRALDAWADQRLVVVKLDHGVAPVGLRDLPAIDASFAAQREFKWQEVADAVRLALQPPPAQADSGVGGEAGRRDNAEQVRRKARGQRRLALILCLLLMLPGLGAMAAAVSIWLVNRIGPAPGTVADLIAGIDAFGVDRGAPADVTPTVFAVAFVLLVLAPLGLILFRTAQRMRLDAYAREHPELYEDYEGAPAPLATTDAVFVSYARANADAVMPVIEAAKSAGKKLWIDQQGIGAGQGWAGEIVRAIKAAGGVVVMCSKAAFESDHVKREIYLADRYRKKLTPVFIEQAEPPEDFEYFFAGVQLLNLFETPEAERPQALMRALGAQS